MKVIMVSGGQGFIGKNLIDYLLQINEAYKVISLDRASVTDQDNLKELEGNSKYSLVTGDICDPKQAKKIIKEYNPDYVINLPVELQTAPDSEGLFLYDKANAIGTLNLLSSLKKHWKESEYSNKRFIQVSTAQTYGAKAIANTFCRKFKMPVITTRSCYNYGPYQNIEEFIPICILKALKGEPISIFGDGTTIREWIHIYDYCSAIIKVLSEGKIGETYFIGSGEKASNLELVKIILENSGEQGNNIASVAERLNANWQYALDKEKDNEISEWRCRYSLVEGLRDTIKWYKENTEL